jgi:putative SOS response-associated peptidase YedK
MRGEWIRTFAIITTRTNELGADIRDRMPLILAPTHYVRWPSDDPDPRE